MRARQALALAVATTSLAACDVTLPWTASGSPPRPAALPSSLAFVARVDDPTPPPAQVVRLSSVPPGFSLAASAESWFAAECSAVADDGTALVTVTVARPADVGEGARTGTLRVSLCAAGVCDEVEGSPLRVPLTYAVGPIPLVVAPISLRFDQLVGGPAPASQRVRLEGDPNAGPWEVAVDTGAAPGWLEVTPSDGTTMPAEVSVAVLGTPASTSSSLPADTGTLVFSRAGRTASVAVERWGIAARLHVPTDTVYFTATRDGPLPEPQMVALTTDADLPVAFRTVPVYSDGIGLARAPGEGVAPCLLPVSVTTTSLPAGRYTGTVRIYSSGQWDIPVVLDLSDPAP